MAIWEKNGYPLFRIFIVDRRSLYVCKDNSTCINLQIMIQEKLASTSDDTHRNPENQFSKPIVR